MNEAEIVKADQFKYMLLGRLQSDNEYFLGCGGRNEAILWAGNVTDQIAKMRELYEDIVVKPEWITLEIINDYENKMMEAV